jgi:hypothetical protein
VRLWQLPQGSLTTSGAAGSADVPKARIGITVEFAFFGCGGADGITASQISDKKCCRESGCD